MPRPIIQGPYRTFRRLNAEESFLEFEGSTITIPMRGRRSVDDPWMEDEIKLAAFMRLEVFPAYRNNLGTREFQFIIRDWYLYGRSPMLNRLFFADPRGRFVEEHAAFVPAVVTFNVSNNYEVKVMDGELSADQLFAPTRRLEIRGLTSHHLRRWVRTDGDQRYGLAEQILYWRIQSAGSEPEDLAVLSQLLGGKPTGPVIVFHRKHPDERDPFSIASATDRAAHLLAIGELATPEQGQGPVTFVAREPMPRQAGLEANRVQMRGNTVLSPLAKARQPLEFRWSLAASLSQEGLSRALADGKRKQLNGALRIVSPARSLGTADQGPDVGDPFDSADFPARITYAINYDIAINRQAFVEDQAGIAIAVGAQEIPPRDVTVAFDKPHIGTVLGHFLEFGPGHCTGMHEIPEEDYRHNVNFARYWRTVPLAATDDWTAFADFDSARVY